MLRQPIEDVLAGARSVLLVGAGGGWDVVGAVPLLVAALASTDTAFEVGAIIDGMRKSLTVREPTRIPL